MPSTRAQLSPQGPEERGTNGHAHSFAPGFVWPNAASGSTTWVAGSSPVSQSLLFSALSYPSHHQTTFTRTHVCVYVCSSMFTGIFLGLNMSFEL